MNPALALIEQTYLTLLRHPLDGWRIENQKLLCNLRNFIAEATGRTDQEVQEHFERRAAHSRLTHEQKATVLRSYGFIVGERDPDYNPAHAGAFMVRENAENTDDDWCVVGDDLNELIDDAFRLASHFSYFDAVCADVAAGGLGILTGAAPAT